MKTAQTDYMGRYPLDIHLSNSRPISALQRLWEPSDGSLPAIYLAHGAPPTLDDPLWASELFEWSQSMPKPRGIVIISAHWENAPATISAPGIQRELVYDFGGFQQRYFDLTYTTPDATSLGQDVKALFTGETIHEDPKRGLDHGAWVPLMLMYPLADVPVIQLSMPTHDADKLITMGKKLKTLREQGILIIGSGFITHGLQFLNRSFFSGEVAGGPGWSRDFDTWAAEALEHGDIDTLAAFRQKAPGMPYAHPTVEHYTPLFITLGASDSINAGVKTTIEGFSYGLSKRSFEVH